MNPMQEYHTKTEELHSLVQSLSYQLRLQLNETKIKNNELQSINGDLTTEIEGLKRQIQDLHRDMEEQNVDCTTRLKQQLARHQRLSRQLFQRLSVVNESKQIMQRDHDSEIETMHKKHHDEIVQFRIKLKESQMDFETVRAQKGVLQQQYLGLQHENDVLSAELSELRGALKGRIIESNAAAQTANRKIQRLTNIQSKCLDDLKCAKFTISRMRHLENAIDAVLSRSYKDIVEEDGCGDVLKSTISADRAQARLLGIQMLPKRIANLHKSRLHLKQKLKQTNSFWRIKTQSMAAKFMAVNERNHSLQKDLKCLGWKESDERVDVERKSTTNIAAEVQCIQLQRHVHVLRNCIDQKDAELATLRDNLRTTEAASAEQQRLHCSGILQLSNELMSMRDDECDLSPKSKFIIHELKNQPHHSHFDHKVLPPPQLRLKLNEEADALLIGAEKTVEYKGYDETLKEIEEQMMEHVVTGSDDTGNGECQDWTITPDATSDMILVVADGNEEDEDLKIVDHEESAEEKRFAVSLKVEITGSGHGLPVAALEVE